MQEDGFEKRLLELSERARRQSVYQFTDFLGLPEISAYQKMKKGLFPSDLSGGCKDAERQMVRFGSPELFGYEEPFPITCMQAVPLSHKNAEGFTHRDVLGSLMHLGIDRSVLGDICVKDGIAYFFCVSRLENFFSQELVRIRHTMVACSRAEGIPEHFAGESREVSLQAESERVDAVVAKACHLSRGDSGELFRQGKVYIDGILCEKSSRLLQEGEMVSVRGYGRFHFLGVSGLSRKGKKNLLVEIWTAG